jgi:uncharacterized membrane protein
MHRSATAALFLSISLLGCSTPTGATCPSTQTLSYDNFGRSFMLANCVRCHSASATGAARKGAPVGVDLDSVEGVRAHSKLVDEYAGSGPGGTNTWMPPDAPKPTTAERQQLAEWLACGAP